MMSESSSAADIMVKLCDMCEQLDINGMVDGEANAAAAKASAGRSGTPVDSAGANSAATKAITKSCIVTALMKLCAQVQAYYLTFE
jgi:formylmethanofuran dehydrogenase subunit A